MKPYKNKFTNIFFLLLILLMSLLDFWYFFYSRQPEKITHPYLSIILGLIALIAFVAAVLSPVEAKWKSLRYFFLLAPLNLLAEISNELQLIGGWIFGPLGVIGFIFFILSLRAIKALSADSPSPSV